MMAIPFPLSNRHVDKIFVLSGSGTVKLSGTRSGTASFCNWLAIEHAVQGNIIPDFPVINKSLNLSYAGTDL